MLRDLKQQMALAAEGLRFEEAAVLRDRIRAISETLKEQKVVSPQLVDVDVIALVEERKAVAVTLLFIRLGSVTGLTHFRFSDCTQSPEDCLSDLIRQYYRNEQYIPKTILLPFPLEDRPLLEEILSEWKGQKVELKVPVRGQGRRWMTMAEENCRAAL